MTPGMHSIALVMIVRNEARCLARCLSSVQPWVDQLVVLDTGSTDETVSIAQSHGAQVAHFTWIDDFSAARNAALALSHADWNLVLDADEALLEGGPCLMQLRDQAPTFVGSIEVCSDYQLDTTTGQIAQASSWLPRVLPRGSRFEGRIHEQVAYSGARQRLAVRVSHDGYLPEHMANKGSRNLQLLQQALSDAPNDPYLNYQLGKDHEVHDRFDQAWPHYAQALQLLPIDAGRHPAWRHDLILRALYTLKASGRVAQAIDLAQAEMPHWHDSPDFYFVLGDVLLDHAMAHPEQASELLPMIRSAWMQCLAIGENPALEGAVQGRGSTLALQQLTHFNSLFGEV
jgi:tetratricopeptide (TPR) repeat protein